jgi:hypothetical protein
LLQAKQSFTKFPTMISNPEDEPFAEIAKLAVDCGMTIDGSGQRLRIFQGCRERG